MKENNYFYHNVCCWWGTAGKKSDWNFLPDAPTMNCQNLVSNSGRKYQHFLEKYSDGQWIWMFHFRLVLKEYAIKKIRYCRSTSYLYIKWSIQNIFAINFMCWKKMFNFCSLNPFIFPSPFVYNLRVPILLMNLL